MQSTVYVTVPFKNDHLSHYLHLLIAFIRTATALFCSIALFYVLMYLHCEALYKTKFLRHYTMLFLTSLCLTSVCLLHTTWITREQRDLGRPKLAHGSPRHTWLGHHFEGQRSTCRAWEYCGGLAYIVNIHYLLIFMAPTWKQGALGAADVRDGLQLGRSVHRWIARIGWSGPAWPAWLKAAATRFRCRPGRKHIVAPARPPTACLFSSFVLCNCCFILCKYAATECICGFEFVFFLHIYLCHFDAVNWEWKLNVKT